jgi:hypothetical protein
MRKPASSERAYYAKLSAAYAKASKPKWAFLYAAKALNAAA